MNRKILIPIAVIAGLFSQASVSAVAPEPIVEVQADCASGLTITTSGYPEGASGMFTIGSEPPRYLPLNGSVHTDWPVTIDVFDYVVMAVPGDGQVVRGTVDCHVEPVVVLPEPVIATPVSDPTGTSFEPSELWPGLELADPW